MVLNEYIENLNLTNKEKTDLKIKLESINKVKNIMYRSGVAPGFINKIENVLNVDELESLSEREITDIIEKEFK